MTGDVTERSLYPFLTGYLESLGFVACSEVRGESGQLDIMAIKEHEKFIIEIKVGDKDSRETIKALSQVWAYARDQNTHNVILIDYPQHFRETFSPDLRTYTLDTQTACIAQTKYLNGDYRDKTAKEVLDALNENFENRKIAEVDIRLVIKIIREAIAKVTQTLRTISQEQMDEIIKVIMNKYDLFLALSELRNNEENNTVALNLISYLIINQILFYHMFSVKSQLIPELQEIDSITDLKKQFDNITEIDYKAIYQINIVEKLPENEDIINAFNEIINIFKLVKPELINHDLMGRLFHDLLPYETRKILASFYTNPVAGDILAGLCIDNEDDNVIDPACGSGTLLVSSYNRKRELTNNDDYHEKFVEEQLTGIDIMPFATHLTAVNLSSQSIETTTESLNIAVMDSLSLSKELKNRNVFRLENFSQGFQTTLHLFSDDSEGREYVSSDVTGAVSPDGEDSDFKITKNSFDVCIANPPFSDREKLPNYYLEVLRNYTELTQYCGSQVNLWGYFLALATLLLKEGGILGFVIPINIFRGNATQKIRDFLLNNFTLKYVVKTGKNTAFSENASLRDVLVVAEYKEPPEDNKFDFVIINEHLHNLKFSDAKNISEFIKGNKFSSGGIELDIISYNQSELQESSENLMPYFGLMSTDSGQTLGNFNSFVHQKFGDILIKMEKRMALEGFRPVPAGSSQMLFITNGFKENRTKKGFLILDDENENEVTAYIKNYDDRKFTFKKDTLYKSIRTATDVNTLNIENKLDYLITEPSDDYDELLSITSIRNKHRWSYSRYSAELDSKWTNMVTSRRFRPNSKNTYLFAFYSEEEFVPNNIFKIITLKEEEAKINTLYLNSVMGILNLILLKEQTTEAYTDIQQGDLNQFDIIDVSKLDDNTKRELLELYDEMKDKEFDSLTTQFEQETQSRVMLDTKLLLALGFSRNEITQLLPEVYKAIAFELKHG